LYWCYTIVIKDASILVKGINYYPFKHEYHYNVDWYGWNL